MFHIQKVTIEGTFHVECIPAVNSRTNSEKNPKTKMGTLKLTLYQVFGGNVKAPLECYINSYAF